MPALFQSRFNERLGVPGTGARDRAFGVEVTLILAGRATTVTAVYDEKVDLDEQDATDIATRVERRNWEFDKTTRANGLYIEPREGDKIIEAADGVNPERVWRIAPYNQLAAVDEVRGGFRWRVRTVREK